VNEPNRWAEKRIVAPVERHGSRTVDRARAAWLYSAQVQQRAGIQVDHEALLRTAERLLT